MIPNTEQLCSQIDCSYYLWYPSLVDAVYDDIFSLQLSENDPELVEFIPSAKFQYILDNIKSEGTKAQLRSLYYTSITLFFNESEVLDGDPITHSDPEDLLRKTVDIINKANSVMMSKDKSFSTIFLDLVANSAWILESSGLAYENIAILRLN